MLSSLLKSLDNKSYGAYKCLRGAHDLGPEMRLHIDRVQSDPFAPPSLARVTVPAAWVSPRGLRSPLTEEELRSPAAADMVLRRIVQALPSRGSKEKGSISIDRPGQTVLRRSAVRIDPQGEITICLEIALPAQGRRIRGRAAAELVGTTLPRALERALRFDEDTTRECRGACALYRDQEAIVEYLGEHGLVAFVGDGAVLARKAGNSDLPATKALPFRSPEELAHTISLPSGRQVRGMGIPEGITLIVGGGYHGKSTLLNAVEHGVYHHVAGDGREFVMTVPEACSLRAEDGRNVSGVDISPFIGDIPSGVDTSFFSTSNASGSTSQAASLREALEAGASALLIDEDTSATNFMLRDARMSRLVPREKEPITPLIHRVRALYRDLGISTVLVAGGSGAFLDVADTVICMESYEPFDISARARELAEPIEEQPQVTAPHPRRGRIARALGRGKPRPPRAQGRHVLRDGQDEVDLSALTQLVDVSQTAGIAAILHRIEEAGDERRPLIHQVRSLLLDAHPTDYSTHRGHPGRLAEVRALEVMAAINRHRGLQCHLGKDR